MQPSPLPDDRHAGRFARAMAAVFGLIVVLAALDLGLDLAHGTTTRHVIIEGCVIVFGMVGLGSMTRRLAASRRSEQRMREHAAELADRLEVSRQEADRWRQEAGDLLRGLGSAIDRQFGRWRLTGAEREVALLLLKGLSHKEIAAVRQVSEATVRQQARSMYRKAGISGRHELAAFFLEDLLLPSRSEVPV